MGNLKVATWSLLFICLGLGALQVLAFAPFEYWPLSFVSLTLFFYLTQALKPKRAFLAGLAFGYGLFGFGVSWVYVSLATYGGMPFWMGGIAVLGFAGLMALFIACASAVAASLFSPRHRVIGLPFIWVVFEWMKSWVLTGFPWLDIGYTQTPSWLFSWAPLGGVYLISLMVVLLSSSLVLLLNWLALERSRSDNKALLIWPLVVIVAIVVGSFISERLDWSEPIGIPLEVGVVQANVPVQEKWQASERDKTISKYQTLSRQLLAKKNIDLLVWPETALPLYMQQTDADFWSNITPSNTALLTGILDSPSIAQGNLDESYNAAVLSCEGVTEVYRKRHLVPFGEYLPLRALFSWVLDYLDLPMTDFSSSQGEQSLSCGTIKVGLSICYEDAFAAEYRAFVGDATVLVNISEDAWFGDSFAPHQRRQMAQMRARELSRPMIRSANSGPSLFIDKRGALLEATAQFEVAALSRQVQPQTGETLFKRYGNWVVVLSIILALALAVVGRSSKGVS